MSLLPILTYALSWRSFGITSCSSRIFQISPCGVSVASTISTRRSGFCSSIDSRSNDPFDESVSVLGESARAPSPGRSSLSSKECEPMPSSCPMTVSSLSSSHVGSDAERVRRPNRRVLDAIRLSTFPGCAKDLVEEAMDGLSEGAGEEDRDSGCECSTKPLVRSGESCCWDWCWRCSSSRWKTWLIPSMGEAMTSEVADAVRFLSRTELAMNGNCWWGTGEAGVTEMYGLLICFPIGGSGFDWDRTGITKGDTFGLNSPAESVSTVLELPIESSDGEEV